MRCLHLRAMACFQIPVADSITFLYYLLKWFHEPVGLNKRTMKLSQLLCALAAATAAASRSVHRSEEATALISLSEKEQKRVTKDEKRVLRLAGTKFIDKTFTQSLSTNNLGSAAKVYTYPTTTSHSAAITPLFDSLSASTIKEHLTTFSTFQNRFYKGGYGAESSAWLLSQVNDTLDSSGITSLGATVAPFEHPESDQDSVIATIPGKSASTVVIGADQDEPADLARSGRGRQWFRFNDHPRGAARTSDLRDGAGW